MTDKTESTAAQPIVAWILFRRDEDGLEPVQFYGGTEKPNGEFKDRFELRAVCFLSEDEVTAKAQRYDWLKARLLCADFQYGELSETCSALVFEIPDDMRVSANLDETIDDAMAKPRGAS